MSCDTVNAGNIVVNNTVDGNGEPGILAEVLDFSDHPPAELLVQNNVAYANTYGIEFDGPAEIEGNTAYANDDGIYQIPSYGGIYVGSSGTIIANNVYDNQNSGIVANFGSVVQGNVVFSNAIGIAGEMDVMDYGPGEVDAVPFEGTITNNTVFGNTTTGILVSGATSAKVINNTVYQQSGDAIDVTPTTYDSEYGAQTAPSSNVSLRNNILWTNAGYDINVATDSQQGFSSDYNLLYATGTGLIGFWQLGFNDLQDWKDEIGQDVHSISVDPLFINVTINDFHLQSGSPAVAAGDPASDYSLQPSPTGGSINLGAYGNTPEATTTAASGVLIEQVGGLTETVEGGADGSYSIVLTSEPASDVVASVIPNSELSVSPPSVTFTTSNWNLPQTISVTALPDEFAEGDHTVALGYAVASTDPNYNGIAVPSVSVLIDQPTNNTGISLSRSTISAAASSIQVGGVTTVTLTVRDGSGSQGTSGGLAALLRTWCWKCRRRLWLCHGQPRWHIHGYFFRHYARRRHNHCYD